DLTTPGPVLERLRRPGGLLYGRDVLPRLVVARTVPSVQRVEDAEPRLPRRLQNLQHVLNAVIGFRDRADPSPAFAALGNKIVIRVDQQERHGVRIMYIVSHHGATASLARVMA